MVTHRIDQAAVIAALRGAAPYIRLYKGKIFVIKAGGAIFGDAAGTRSLVEQIAILHHLGIRVVLVHGGGPQLDEMQRSLGIEPRMVRGRRMTDDRSIDATTMVLNGLINTRILATCRELGIDAVGLSGVDAGLVRANRRPPVQVDGESVDYGYVGDIVSIDTSVVRKELDAGLMPVDQPRVGRRRGGRAQHQCRYGRGCDRSRARRRETDPLHGRPGHPRAPRRPALDRVLHGPRGPQAPRKSGSLADGMLPKASAIESAIRGGVRRVHVISYNARDSVLAEVFTNEGTGTMIVADVKALTPAEQHPEGATKP